MKGKLWQPVWRIDILKLVLKGLLFISVIWVSGLSKFYWFFFPSEEEGEEILRQRGQFPALPFTASDTGSPSPRSPRSPGSVSSYSNGGSPHPVGVPWGDFSATGNFKFPNMPHKYSSNGRVKKKPTVSEGIAKSPGSGKCSLIAGSWLKKPKTNDILHRDPSLFLRRFCSAFNFLHIL